MPFIADSFFANEYTLEVSSPGPKRPLKKIEDFYNENIFLIGCLPDFPVCRTWGCRNCEAAFFKDNKFNRGHLEGVFHRDKEGKLRVGYPD